MRNPRHELLGRVIDEVSAHGLADRSLRELALAVGTSHRMLIYHFGSRDGLVAAVVAATEADQRDSFIQLAATATDPADLIRKLWAQVSAPELRSFVRLFFETVAASGRTGAAADLTGPWLDDSAPVSARFAIGFDPIEVRLGVAVVRGLLIDVLATDDTAAATESLERFLSFWELARAEQPGR
jgi:AcrR family transcriptional regulator